MLLRHNFPNVILPEYNAATVVGHTTATPQVCTDSVSQPCCTLLSKARHHDASHLLCQHERDKWAKAQRTTMWDQQHSSLNTSYSYQAAEAAAIHMHRAKSYTVQSLAGRVPARPSPWWSQMQQSVQRVSLACVSFMHLQQLIEEGVQPVADEGAVGQRDEPVDLREVPFKLLLHGSTRWTSVWPSSYSRQRGGCIGGGARVTASTRRCCR